MTDDLDQRNLNEAGGAQMQVAPTPHLNLGPFGIDAFPTGIRFSVAALVFALKALSILAAGPDLAGNPCRGWTIKDAIAFDPQQLRRLDVNHTGQERGAGVPPISQNDGMQPACDQQRHHRLQLASSHFCGQFTRFHPRCIQHIGALTSLGGQEDHVAHHPSGTRGMRVLGQIGHGNQRPISSSLSFWAIQIAGIHAQKHDLTPLGQWRAVHKDRCRRRSASI
jgi:hypothetical protein